MREIQIVYEVFKLVGTERPLKESGSFKGRIQGQFKESRTRNRNC